MNSAIPFGEHLTSKKLDAGVFLTHQWFSKHNDPPSEKMYEKIPATQATTTKDFTRELMHNTARRLVIHPGNQSYRGNLFVLVDHKTASTCEPIVYMLKHNNMATIVGEKTAGAMLSAVPLKITDKYYLFMPIADYYTNDGVRLEQKGVKPDIKIESQNALEYVRENFLK
ncbi:MAG: S41 family peptidase [Bacteroidales bacterium]|nr:S41 family peptidase [Bacteroidales bacterium]